jgi:tetratricopeptide (TPR) repeat protein
VVSRRQKRAPRSPRSSSHPPSGRSYPSWIGIAGLALVLTAAAGWAYATSFRGVFVLDDQFGIADNPNIKTLWPLTKAMSAPPELPVSARPVASLTLAINYALAPEDVRDVLTSGGPGATPERHDQYLRNVWGYHFLNLTLHVMAGLSLFGVLRRTFRSGRLAARFAAHATALAFAITLLWIVHPLLTDAVTYVVQRTEVLMGLFYLSTLYCAIRAAEPDLPLRVRRSWMVGSVVSCALGMGSKQTMVTAPLMVWLWDWTFVSDVPSRQDDRARGDRRYLYAGLAATWGILGALVAMERWPHSIGLNREGWTPWTYLLTQSGVIVHYLRLAFVPSPLALDYDGWPMARSVVDIAPHGALLLILLAATVVAIVRRHPAGFLGGWFFALLAPSSSVLPLATEIAAERRMYLPLAAIITAVVAAVYLLGRRASGSLIADPRLRAVAGTAAAVALLGSVAVVLGAATAARNRDYWSDERIWADTVAKRPGNSRARVNYGVDLYAAGRLREAEQQLREAVRLKETSAPAHANLGPVLCALGQLDEGIAHLERALELDPEYSAAHGNLGEAYAAQGRRALAAHQFALAVERAPDNPFFLNRLGWLLATSPEDAVRNGARAVAVAERAASITSRRDMMSLETLSAAYAEAGRFPEAVATVREALALAERQGNRAIVPDLTNRLALFEAGRKYREPS